MLAAMLLGVSARDRLELEPLTVPKGPARCRPADGPTTLSSPVSPQGSRKLSASAGEDLCCDESRVLGCCQAANGASAIQIQPKSWSFCMLWEVSRENQRH